MHEPTPQYEQVRHELQQLAGPDMPVRIIDLARILGIAVFAQPASSGHNASIDVHDGSLRITVNHHMSAESKRMAIAHALAHCELHRDEILQQGDMDKHGNIQDARYRYIEQQANAMAHDMLMPEQEFYNRCMEKVVTVDALAEYFLVTPEAIQARAWNLGLAIVK